MSGIRTDCLCHCGWSAVALCYVCFSLYLWYQSHRIHLASDCVSMQWSHGNTDPWCSSDRQNHRLSRYTWYRCTIPHWDVPVWMFIQDILEFMTEIEFCGGNHPWSFPLGSDPHFLHIFSDDTFRNGLSLLTQFSGDLGSSIVLFWSVINILYFVS